MNTWRSSDILRKRVSKLILIVGFVALTFGAYQAYTASTDGYEVSIYTSTPLSFWVGVGIALSVSILLSFTSGFDRYQSLSLSLGGSSMTAVLGLPLLRGYAFYGSGDALTHLGLLQDISAGTMELSDLFYPGLHSVAIFVHNITGNPLRSSLLLAVLVFSIAFFVFVPLIVRFTVSDTRTVAISAFSAFLLLPITNLETFVTAHPYTQTIFFSPIVIYLALRFVFDPRGQALTSFSLLLGLTSITLILSHPLQALNIFLLFLGIVLTQFMYRKEDNRIGGYQSLKYHTTFLGGLLAINVTGTEIFRSAVRSYLPSILSYFQGAAIAGKATASQTESLTTIGITPVELVLRMFSVSLLYSALAGLFVVFNVYTRLQTKLSTQQRQLGYSVLGAFAFLPLGIAIYARPLSSFSSLTGAILIVAILLVGSGISLLLAHLLLVYGSGTEYKSSTDYTNALITYTTVGVAFVFPFFLVFFIGSIVGLHFRILGYFLMLATILGAVALGRSINLLETVVSPPITDITNILVVGILLVASVAVLFPSPYIYQSNSHVTENNLDGFETTLEHNDESLALAGVREGPFRYSDAIEGSQDSTRYEADMMGENLTNLPAAREDPYYLVTTTYNMVRESRVYRGLRFTGSEFRSLDNQRGVDRIQSTGEYTLYRSR